MILSLQYAIRFGTAAITTRGLKEQDMSAIVDLIDEVITHPEEEEVIVKVKEKVNKLMKNLPLFNSGQ